MIQGESLEAKVRFEGLLLFMIYIFFHFIFPRLFWRKRGREKNTKYQISNSRIKLKNETRKKEEEKRE